MFEIQAKGYEDNGNWGDAVRVLTHIDEKGNYVYSTRVDKGLTWKNKDKALEAYRLVEKFAQSERDEPVLYDLTDSALGEKVEVN